MIVVADTSVILNLCCVRQEGLLQQLFQRVLIPSQVADEFVRLAKRQSRFSGMLLPGWIEIMPAPSSFPPEVTQAHLDPGESAAIALCFSQHADALLIDESLGREVAARLGLRAVGILGVLINARRRKMIPGVKIILDELENKAGFWVAPSLRQHVLHLAGE
jgi:predicted nucleic acid-binding protein